MSKEDKKSYEIQAVLKR